MLLVMTVPLEPLAQLDQKAILAIPVELLELQVLLGILDPKVLLDQQVQQVLVVQ